MAIEAFSNNELLNFVIYDTISAKPTYNITLHGSSSYQTTTPTENSNLKPQDDNHHHHHHNGCPFVDSSNGQNSEVQGERKKKKRKRSKLRVCKDKEVAETQRMTHIVVERNRRRQMNDHLAVLRSLMPQSYAQRGDQASIVGGAIEFVKELEHLLQSLEAQKLRSLQQMPPPSPIENNTTTAAAATKVASPPFGQFFAYPQYTWSQTPNKNISSCCSSGSNEAAAIADIEVTLIETHANLRILARRRSSKQLLKMVTGFQTLCFTILHLNVTTMDPLVLYSVSVKVEEGCQLTSVDDIAGAVHHMLRIIEEEETVLY